MARPKNTNKNTNTIQISISLPKDLVEKIDDLAKQVNRNRSNYITHTLAEVAKNSNQD